MLVLLGFKIHSSELQNFPIVPPQKPDDDEVKYISCYHNRPDRLIVDIGRCQSHEPSLVACLVAVQSVEDGEENSTSNDAKHEKDVAAHGCESYK